jgi:NitT/TauT family transport system ATP-binding protein
LDAIVRARVTQDLLDLVQQAGISVLLVTHDLEEAITVSDVVHVLSGGPRAHILASRTVPIQRPRDLLGVRGHAAFAPLLRQLWLDLETASSPALAGTGERFAA